MAECKDANKNPSCPYITKINAQGEAISRIEVALIGEDMQSGLVGKFKKIEGKVDNALLRKWGPKDYAFALTALAAIITAATALIAGMPI